MSTLQEIITNALSEVMNNRGAKSTTAVPGAKVVEWYGTNKATRQPKTYEVNGQKISRHLYRKLVQALRSQGAI